MRQTLKALIIGACLLAAAWAQPASTPHSLRHPRPGWDRLALNSGQTSLPSGATSEKSASNVGRRWNLRTYPGGTWAQMGNANDVGVAVALGDTRADPETHLFTVRLLDKNGPQWTDLGAINTYFGWLNWPYIADTGLVVGYAAAADGNLHACLWKGATKVDLGTLADIGYAGFDNSQAVLANKLGTLIVGASWSSETGAQLPVIWKPQLGGGWKAMVPDTLGYPYGFALTVNDFGQVAGAVNDDEGNYFATVWNPLPGWNRWKAIRLPSSQDWPVAIVGDINEKGEMVGDVLSYDWAYGYSSLWQPTDPSREHYTLKLLANPWGVPNGDTAEGINDQGDIVGGSWDNDFIPHAVRWSTKDPNFVQLLGFPGDYSLAYKVNDGRIVTGFYNNFDGGLGFAYAVQLH